MAYSQQQGPWRLSPSRSRACLIKQLTLETSQIARLGAVGVSSCCAAAPKIGRVASQLTTSVSGPGDSGCSLAGAQEAQTF